MDITGIIADFENNVRCHALDTPGAYARWLWQDEKGSRKMGNNEYGCADAANILYTLGAFPTGIEQRQAAVGALQQFQHKDTGIFYEGTHHLLHCTAHCAAALELFDAKPLYPLTQLHPYLTPDGLYTLLDGLDWQGTPWSQAHLGAGVYAALTVTGEATREFSRCYFAWLTENADPEFGIGRRGAVQSGRDSLDHHLYGWFHYLFNFSFARMPFPHAHKLIDSCIAMYKDGTLGPHFGRGIGFCEIDWVYALHRAAAQTGYRFDEAIALLQDFAPKYLRYIETLDKEHDEQWNDLHAAFGALCAVAELQLALPGQLQSEKPLKLVLDRRPFI